MKPTSRTLKHYRDHGWLCGMVERRIPYRNISVDLFGIIDIVAINGNETAGIQSTGQAFSAHNKKILASEHSAKWLESGNRLILIGWRKIKVKRGGKAVRWSPRIKEYSLEDFL